jgi:uncharacterized protein
LERIVLWTLAVLCVVAGTAGTVLPALPGVPLVFLGLLIGAWIDGFDKVGGWPLTILAVLTLISLIADLVSAAYGAKRVDASKQALLGAFLGAFLGILGGLPGLIFGPFIGAAVGEYLARRDAFRAGQVGLATWMGLVLGVAAKLALCFVMVGVFITAYFWK